MHYRVSETHLASRRRAPRRMLVMMVAVLTVITLAVAANPQHPDEPILPGLGLVAAVMAAAYFFNLRRIKAETRTLETLSIAVTPNGLDTANQHGRSLLNRNEIRRITRCRFILSPGVVLFVLQTDQGELTVPPLDRPEAFEQEVRKTLSSIHFQNKRRLLSC